MFRKDFRTIFFTVGIALWFWGGGFSHLAMAETRGANTLVINIIGIKPVEGQVRVALYNAAEKWLEESFFNTVLEVKSQKVEWRVDDVPEGEYGIAAFHDQNKNGEADRNFLGIPKESYGFSNNVKAVFRAPQWDEVKFIVNSTKEVEVKLESWNQ
ncbi:conserved hypothetical protein [Nitrosococcus halophilus Nc 4]|uniref:DUF2141 domain-containing protein n=1 Tax=Nitrosococcus halophilus (strain Nc4) TaxID=472759 RepID=D5BXN1_NITHN|nr:conserved hypothetical protein [Nitrosococcus halophilus Nc 4]